MTKVDEIHDKPLSKILWHNFLGGVAWGLGISIGAALIIALGTFILARIDYIPVIGSIVLNIVEFVQQNSPNL